MNRDFHRAESNNCSEQDLIDYEARFGEPPEWYQEYQLEEKARLTEEFDRVNPQLTFGKVIVEARKAKGWNQRKTAELLGIHYSYLTKLETDKSDCNLSYLKVIRLAELLELDVDLLLRLSGHIPDDVLRDFEELMVKYQQMPLLLRRMHEDRNFAREIFHKLGVEN